MEKKVSAFFGILLVALLSFGFTSAASITYDGATLSGTEGEEIAFSINLTTDYNDTVYINWSTSTTSPIVITDFASGNNYSNGNRDVSGFEVTIPDYNTSRTLYADVYNSTNGSFIERLSKSISVKVEENSSSSSSTTYHYCNDFSGEKGHLEIAEVNIENKGSGDDQEWEYLDEIVIEVTIENTDDENIDDVIVELLIKDDNNNTITKKNIGLDDDEEDLGRIKDDDEEIATFTIDEVPIDLDDGEYYLYIRAYEDGNEDAECVSESEDFTNSDETYFKFEVVSSDKSTVIVKSDLPNVKASCGDDNVEVSFMVYNTGSDDEDSVLVTLENSKLGIYEKAVIDNLRDGKGKEVTFFITVPEEVENTYEKLKIYTYYDYDDDEDEEDEYAYGESSEDENDDFEMYLEILSCKAPKPTVMANLASEAKVDENLIVKTTISNNGDENDFVISASGFESWAKLVSIDPQTTSIDENGNQEVIITLTPTKAGSQTFKINTLVDGEMYEQSLTVNIAEKPGLFGMVNDVVFYMVIAVVALLALIILVLIVKVSRRSAVRVAEF
ncbi:putative S-layer protein [Methanococcoides sp. SA1]|nr:putative S-layer protein [Methanococcoides sp. SA1]